MHLTNFMTDTSQSNSALIAIQASEDPIFGREYIRILVIGSRRGVISIIHTLHNLQFAEVGEWSPLLPTANPGEMMSILTRHIFVN
ncbi:hypothetical protein [Nostoc sp. CHAB 5715]|uniref:hypothetical protein n=1 Tax=Nostoc sp. CHAB 5715 TaxID=2780400 RepID=UPI001E4296F7|nr:hypothetical protein [Nostoc sp. CHAB 5715]MCC5620930.1 hypothetical protein [Nostoc sp. CHAB 5715]